MKNIAAVLSNCTHFFKPFLNLFLLVSTVFCFSACQTPQYHDPFPMNQDEVKEMFTLDAHGRRSKPGAGMIRDCATMKALGETQCAYIICKDDKAQPSGLSCDYHLPKSQKTEILLGSSGKFSVKDENFGVTIKSLVADYEAGKTKNLEQFCSQDAVVCYFKAKPFPPSKPPSSAKLATLAHKESLSMNGESLEVSVFKD